MTTFFGNNYKEWGDPGCLGIMGCLTIPFAWLFAVQSRGRIGGGGSLAGYFTPWPCEALLFQKLTSYILRTVKVTSAGDYAEAGKKICMSRPIIVLICTISIIF